MIVVKIIGMTLLCYFLAKGMSINALKDANEAKEELKDIKDKAKEAYQLMGAEKAILLKTIKELRKEIKYLKGIK